jgi:hypothetical protein
MENVIDIPSIDTTRAGTALTEANVVLDSAKSVVIKTPEQANQAGDWRNKIKAKLKQLDAERKELTKPLDDVKSKIMDKYRPATEALDAAYKLFDQALIKWLDDQEKIRQEQQRKLDEEAEKKRKSAEAKAAEWADKGNDKKAEEWAEKAETVVAPIVAAAPKVTGMMFRDDWDFEITNSTIVPRQFMIPDEKAIRAYVKATKGKSPIEGVRIIPKKVAATSR